MTRQVLTRAAARLREARDGQTTVVVSASPLVLDRMDVIQVMRGGHVVGEGTHAELMRSDTEAAALYRSVVARSLSAAEPADSERLDDADTGSIDTLWNEAVQTGAIPVHRTSGEEGSDAFADR